MSEIIRARGLTKRFADLVAVNGIDFSVEAGECFGLLGPNGAGKTSTIRWGVFRAGALEHAPPLGEVATTAEQPRAEMPHKKVLPNEGLTPIGGKE